MLTNKRFVAFVFLFLLGFYGCQPRSENSIEQELPTIASLVTPVKVGSGEPSLFATPNGKVYLSWIEPVDSLTMALKFSELESNSWSTPKTIAQGANWFVNWADFPSLVVNTDGTMAAHWLQKRTEGTYDYDVYVSQSSDRGATWAEPFIIHQDGIAAEHGFVSMVPLPDQTIFAAWLDGRNTKTAEHSDHTNDAHEHAGGPMSIRAAQFDINGNIFKEVALDERVCDCCQTDVALTTNGPVVVYRDRSENEIRDISIVRAVDDRWTEPKKVSNDGWEIAGCPVNGPRIEALGNFVAVAWFTGADTVNQANLAFSSDGGATFGNPIRIDEGQPLGRMDLIMMDDHSVMVTWMEGTADGAEIRTTHFGPQGDQRKTYTVAQNSKSRASGFPRMARQGHRIYWAWTQVDSTSSVQTAYLDII